MSWSMTSTMRNLCSSRALSLKRRLLLVSGPSGVGKGTVIGQLLRDKDIGRNFALCVSHTTRKRRPGEIDGVHYHFASESDMEHGIENGKFIEHSRSSHGVLYGTSYLELQRISESRGIAVLDVDSNGIVNTIRKCKSKFPADIHCVGLVPPNIKALESRLRERGTESEAEIAMRLASVQYQIDFCKTSDLLDECIVNEDSWRVGFPRVRSLVTAWWPDILDCEHRDQ